MKIFIVLIVIKLNSRFPKFCPDDVQMFIMMHILGFRNQFEFKYPSFRMKVTVPDQIMP